MASSRTGARHVVLVLLFTAAIAAGKASSSESDDVASAPAVARAPCGEDAAAAAEAASSFLRSRCGTTLYPVVCYDSLLPYAGAFQTSRVRLARAAANVTAARLRAFSASLDGLVRRGAGADDVGVATPPRVATALRDCAGTISSAAGLARRSWAALGRLDAATAAGGSSGAAGGSRQARWEVSNAQTWLSAAMANEATCTDGFTDAGNAAVAIDEVAAEAANVSKYTSNALALVNGIAL